MAVKVILLEDDKKLGTKGQVVQVADGYARNYLIPRGLAKEGSTGNLKNLALEQQRQSQQQEKQHLAMVAKAARLNGTRLEIKARTGDGGKLFGSVTSKDGRAMVPPPGKMWTGGGLRLMSPYSGQLPDRN